jgi:putative two-component system response regulator
MADTSYVEKLTVLVVDDTLDNLSLMTGLLKDLYKVKIANNGERALKVALTGTPPDIILLDIMMPVMDGYETCRQLKAEKLRSHPRFSHFLDDDKTIERADCR